MPTLGGVFIPKEKIEVKSGEDREKIRFYSQFFATAVFIAAVFYMIVKW